MQGAKQDVSTVVKDSLGTVAVMYVHIQDRQTIGPATHLLRCDGDVIEKTEPARLIVICVMARWPTKGISFMLALKHQIGS